MMTVKIWSVAEGQPEQFVGVVVVPVQRVASGSDMSEGGWYEIRGEKNDVIVGPEGMSKIELTFVYKEAPQGIPPLLGWLHKQVAATKEWNRRFAALDAYDQMLHFFESPEMAQADPPQELSSMNVRGCKVEPADDEANPDHSVPRRPFCLSVATATKRIVLHADSIEDRDTWMLALDAVGNPTDALAATLEELTKPRDVEPVQEPEPRPQPQEPPQQEPQQSQQQAPPVQQQAPQVAREDPKADSPVRPISQTVQLTNTSTISSPGGDEQLRRKYEATRRALADHVAKCRELEARCQALSEAGQTDMDAVALLQENKQAMLALHEMELVLERERADRSKLMEENQALAQQTHDLLQEKAAWVAGGGGGANDSGDSGALRAKLAELAQENAKLRKMAENGAGEDGATRLMEKAMVEQVQGEKSKLEGEIAHLRAQLTAHQADDDHAMVVQMRQLQADKDHLQDLVNQLRQSQREVVESHPNLTPELAEARAHIKKLAFENEELQQKFEASRQALAHQMEEADPHAGQDIQELKAKLREMEQRAIMAAEGYDASVRALEHEKEEMHAQFEAKLARIAAHDAPMEEEHRLEHHVLVKQLEDAHETVVDLKQRQLKTEQALGDAVAERDELRATAEARENRMAAAEDVARALKMDNEVLKTRLETIEEEEKRHTQTLEDQARSLRATTGPGTLPAYGAPQAQRVMPSAKDLIADITSTLSTRNSRLMKNQTDGPQTWNSHSSFASNGSLSKSPVVNLASKTNTSAESSDPFLM